MKNKGGVPFPSIALLRVICAPQVSCPCGSLVLNAAWMIYIPQCIPSHPIVDGRSRISLRWLRASWGPATSSGQCSGTGRGNGTFPLHFVSHTLGCAVSPRLSDVSPHLCDSHSGLLTRSTLPRASPPSPSTFLSTVWRDR